MRPAWHAQAERILRSDVLPWIGERPVHRLTRREIAALVDRIESRGSYRVAGMSLILVRAVIRHGIAKGIIDSDPTIGLKAAPVRQRARVLTRPEIAAIWQAAAGLDDYGRIIRLLLASRRRRGEIGGLRWSEVDIEARVIALPDTRTKNRRPHAVPLTGLMAALGVRVEVVEAVLNHRSGLMRGVAGIYIRHGYEAEMHAALELWGEELRRIVTVP